MRPVDTGNPDPPPGPGSPPCLRPRRPCSRRSLLLAAADTAAQDSPQRKGGFGAGPRIPKAQLTPHWFADDTRFWYRNDLKGGGKEFVLVDAETGKKAPAFDHTKLAAGLSKAAGTEYKPDRLPFDDIEFARRREGGPVRRRRQAVVVRPVHV